MFRFIRKLFLLLLVVLVAGLGYALWPRKADLRGFDADAVARLETAMWRDYYNHDHQALAAKLYTLNRDLYHFSPADSVRLAYSAGKAAQLFQPTASRAEAQVALPLLMSYFTLMQQSSDEAFDPENAARGNRQERDCTAGTASRRRRDRPVERPAGRRSRIGVGNEPVIPRGDREQRGPAGQIAEVDGALDRATLEQ